MKIAVSSNLSVVVQAMKVQLDELLDAEKILKEAAFNSQALIQNRVQQRGQNVEGSQMQNKRTGKAYSNMYAAIRKSKGRQTNIVDLTFKGDLFRSFIVQPVGKFGYQLGFLSKRETDKAEKNEAYYGKVFFLAADELSITESIILSRINQILSK